MGRGTTHARYPELLNLVQHGVFDPAAVVTKEMSLARSMAAID